MTISTKESRFPNAGTSANNLPSRKHSSDLMDLDDESGEEDSTGIEQEEITQQDTCDKDFQLDDDDMARLDEGS
ncbi:MAG TPA: hypothetical protein VFW00_00660 [Rhodocyclaceae bacterium]|nr:hypothetical protein [Rhodocyclaceae bacterium]